VGLFVFVTRTTSIRFDKKYVGLVLCSSDREKLGLSKGTIARLVGMYGRVGSASMISMGFVFALSLGSFAYTVFGNVGIDVVCVGSHTAVWNLLFFVNICCDSDK